MLICGGANYAYEQVNSELSSFLSTHYGVLESAFKLAVCGVKLHSEHEDSCCVMVQVLDGAVFTQNKVSRVEENFVAEAKNKVSKGAKPDYIALGEIPVVLSKGVINIPEMILYWKKKYTM
ncbi:hypothetical protein EON65_34460 [archaeon]|nr:MAG: hypothetical protein EON65_34460 [archaeon]